MIKRNQQDETMDSAREKRTHRNLSERAKAQNDTAQLQYGCCETNSMKSEDETVRHLSSYNRTCFTIKTLHFSFLKIIPFRLDDISL